MRIDGQTEFDAPRHDVWEVLLDPEIIRQCMPGCRELEETDPDTYQASLKIGVGAVSGSYEGRLRIHDKVAPIRYAMRFSGSGKQGFIEGSGEARLEENGDGRTTVAYACDVEVGGPIAAVGQRVLRGVSQFLVSQMFSNLRRFVKQGERNEASAL